MRVVLTDGEGFSGTFIRWYTWSSVAHAAIQLDDGSFIDATPSHGVSHHTGVSGSVVRFFDVEYPTIPSRTLVEERVRAWLSAQLGKPYDWSAIYGMAFRRDWHKDDKWFCSELVEGAFSAAGYPLVNGSLILDRVTPRDLLLSTRLKSR